MERVELDTLTFDDRGWLPAIVQDAENDEVLRMAWMSRESVERHLDEGRTVFWSRSRNELWRKGETSGHIQHVDEIWVDCDGNVLLARVHQVGPACHLGRRSCFHRGFVMLRLVILKGSLEEQTLRVLEAADLHVRRGSLRDYHGTVDDERIERVSLLRPQEIPTYIQDGLFDWASPGGIGSMRLEPTSRSSPPSSTRRAAPAGAFGSCSPFPATTRRTVPRNSRPIHASPPST